MEAAARAQPASGEPVYSRRQPELGTLYRVVRENWIVQTERLHDARGRVYLELAEGTDAEAERGMAMLRKLVG